VLQPPVFDDKLAGLGSLDPHRRAAAAPSDYTQMIRGAPPAAPKAASPAPSQKPAGSASGAAAPAEKQKLPPMLLFVLNGILFLLIAVVAFVFFKRKPTTPAVQPPAVTAPALPNPAPPSPPR
jgi:hypothetical protein